MASAKEENERKKNPPKFMRKIRDDEELTVKQKEKRYLIDFLFYVELNKERAKKSDIAFYDDYDRIFGWVNHEIRQVSVKLPNSIQIDIPDKVIGNYVINEPIEGQERVERKFRKSKKGKNYYDDTLLEHITGILARDPKMQEFYYKYPADYLPAVKILSIEEIEDGDGKREQNKKT